MAKRLFYVERIGKNSALLIERDEDATEEEVPREWLPQGTEAGDWLVLEAVKGKTIHVLMARRRRRGVLPFVKDEDEAAAAKERVQSLMDDLSR